MRYVSTRGRAPVLPFEDAMLAGLAADGGLYVPDEVPVFGRDALAALAGQSYEAVAEAVMAPFVENCPMAEELPGLIRRAYRGFDHRLRCPLIQIAPDDWLLELHHGPTLAFKDVAMQLIGPMFESVLARRDDRVTIVGATSGDTGSAAIEAFADNPRADVFILYPEGRVSEVQRLQMTTPTAANVHAVAVEGDFDACQALVKAMFADSDFRYDTNLAAINSINWARVLAQVVYYVTSAVALGAPWRSVAFSVPTGNFGDIYAGSIAQRMGVPIQTLIVATNENDILHRALTTGEYRRAAVVQTSAPSMDIQVSSNFERALYDALGRDGLAVGTLMEGIRGGGFTIPEEALARLRAGYASARVSEAETAETIARIHRETGEVIDPHTAIGVHAAGQVGATPGVPMVCLACAHAAKFPDAVEAASGLRPALPERMADLHAREERVTVLPDDLAQVQAFIRRTRTA